MGRTRRFSAWTGWVEFNLQEVPSGDRRLQRVEVCTSQPHLGERRQDSGVGCALRLRPGGDCQKAARARHEPLPNSPNSQRHEFRKNPDFTGVLRFHGWASRCRSLYPTEPVRLVRLVMGHMCYENKNLRYCNAEVSISRRIPLRFLKPKTRPVHCRAMGKSAEEFVSEPNTFALHKPKTPNETQTVWVPSSSIQSSAGSRRRRRNACSGGTYVKVRS